MHGAEMTVDLSKFFIENNAEHFHFEPTKSSICCSHVLRVLAARQNYVKLFIFRVIE